ncbi:MAG: hypothetical protein Q6373_015330 [Candidatus Sigynarchaeota archaeon]
MMPRDKNCLTPCTKIPFIDEDRKRIIVRIKNLEELRKDMPLSSEITRKLEKLNDQDLKLEKNERQQFRNGHLDRYQYRYLATDERAGTFTMVTIEAMCI